MKLQLSSKEVYANTFARQARVSEHFARRWYSLLSRKWTFGLYSSGLRGKTRKSLRSFRLTLTSSLRSAVGSCTTEPGDPVISMARGGLPRQLSGMWLRWEI